MPKISVHGGPSNAAADGPVQVEPPAVGEPVGYAPDDDAVVDLDGDGEITGYEAWTKADLATELERRGLPKTGNKADLVKALTDDDEHAAEPVAEPVSEQTATTESDTNPEGQPAPAG